MGLQLKTPSSRVASSIDWASQVAQIMVLLARMLVMSVREPTSYIYYMWFLKCNPWTSIINIIWELVKIQILRLYIRPIEPGTLLVATSHLCFNGPSGRCWSKVKLKKTLCYSKVYWGKNILFSQSYYSFAQL